MKNFKEELNLNATIAKKLFDNCKYPWEVLSKIKQFILDIIPTLGEEYIEISENVYAHKTAKISKTACIIGPTIIGENTEIRHCAYIRENAIIGNNCVIGNSTEVKNAIIFNNVQCPHYNYIGDSILGEYAHTGAGVILSNVKNDKTNITIKINGEKIDTGLRKFSAIIGDKVEIGCNSVICPGTIICSNTNIYPLTRVRGIIDKNKIVKDMDNIIEKGDYNG